MTARTYTLRCKGCGEVYYDMPKMDIDSDELKAMECNFCPKCEDKASCCSDIYEIDESLIPVKNQLKLF